MQVKADPKAIAARHDPHIQQGRRKVCDAAKWRAEHVERTSIAISMTTAEIGERVFYARKLWRVGADYSLKGLQRQPGIIVPSNTVVVPW